MESYSNDLNVKFEHTPQTNKVAFNLNHVGAHAGDAITVTSLSHTDADTIYVNGSTGSDSNDGTSANPKLTILASINATTSAKIYVLVMNSQHFAEDLSTATTTFLTGLFANTAITATLSTRTLGYTPADANSIFFGATSGTGGGAGTEADPTNTIALAVGLTDGTHNNIVEVDGDTYTEPAIEMTGNFTGMYAADGVKPTYIPTPTLESDANYDATLEVVTETNFKNADVSDVSTAQLTGGNIFVGYSGGFNKGEYAVFNSDGTLSSTETEFASNFIQGLRMCALTNGSCAFVWQDQGGAGEGKLKILNGSGDTVGTATFANDAGSSPGCATLSNGNFVIAYEDEDDSERGKFVIYDSTGSVVDGPRTFTTNRVASLNALQLDNTDFVITYSDSTDSNSKYVMYPQSGGTTPSKAITSLHSAVGGAGSLALLQNNNWLSVYKDANVTDDLIYAIKQEDGTGVASATIVTGNASSYADSIAVLENGSWIVAYRDLGDSNKGKFLIRGEDGSSLKTAQTFESGSSNFTGAVKLLSGEVLIPWDTGAAGAFSVWQPYSLSGITVSSISDINGFIIDGDDQVLYDKSIVVNGAKPSIKWCDLKSSTCPGSSNIYGYAISGDNETDVYNSQIYDNSGGIYLTANVDDCIIQDNEFYRNEGTHAIRIDGAAASSGDITIEHNDVFNNNAGIRLENNNGTNEILKNNIIHNNDNFGVEADTSVSLTYTVRTDSNSGATDGTSVILANPLYLNEGAVSPAAIDLNIKTTVEGYPSDSPAKDLADDSRNAGSHDVRYIGAATTWTSITVPKDRRNSPKIWYEPVAGSKSIGQDGTVEYSKKGQTENVKIKWTGLQNADFAKVRKMWMSDGSEVRIYWQPTTTPNTYTTYTMTRRAFNAGVNHYELSRTGVSDFEVEFSRKYEEA